MNEREKFIALIDEDNAFKIVCSLTVRLRDAVRSTRPDRAAIDNIRDARKLALDRYEALFGEDELDDTLDILDCIYNGS